jgi:hypothetical protein
MGLRHQLNSFILYFSCHEKFYNETALECHREEVHVCELKYTCTVCGKMFHSDFKMRAHISKYHRAGLNEDAYACPSGDCKKPFFRYKRNEDLKKHLKKHHYEIYLEREKIKPTYNRLSKPDYLAEQDKEKKEKKKRK